MKSFTDHSVSSLHEYSGAHSTRLVIIYLWRKSHNCLYNIRFHKEPEVHKVSPHKCLLKSCRLQTLTTSLGEEIYSYS